MPEPPYIFGDDPTHKTGHLGILTLHVIHHAAMGPKAPPAEKRSSDVQQIEGLLLQQKEVRTRWICRERSGRVETIPNSGKTIGKWWFDGGSMVVFQGIVWDLP